MKCKRCNNVIAYGVYNHSIKYFGRALCIPCQKVIELNNKEAEENFEMVRLLEV